MNLRGLENAELLQAVFNSTSDGIAVLETNYKEEDKVDRYSVRLLNDNALKLAANIDYKGALYTDIFPMFKKMDILDKLKKVAETGELSKFDHFYNYNGLSRWIKFKIVRYGNLLIVNTEDRTESHLAEIELRKFLDVTEKQRNIYDSIINNIPDLVYAFDLDYRFIYANEALLNMWDKTAETAIGKGLRENGYEEWHALMHEKEIDSVVATKKPIRGTVSFPHAQLGSRVYDYIFSPVFNKDGEVEFIAGSTRDITDLKRTQENLQQSEARLRSVIDQTPAATLVLSSDNLVIEQINDPMLQLIGQGKEIVGKPLIEVLPELDGQYVWSQVQKVYNEGISFNQSEVLVPHTRNGIMQDHYYNLAYRPRRENGHITGMIQVAIDITEQVLARKKLEDSENRYKILNETLENQVKDRTRELQRSNDDLQQFAHVASHDLKEPVRKIKTFASRLEQNLEGKLDADGSRYIERINIAANRMFAMIEGVLTYSTANSGMQNCEKVDLNKIIRSIETDLEIPLQMTGATIEYDYLPTLEGAPILLYQLFYNLINNSIKFVAFGTLPRVTISSEHTSINDEEFTRIFLKDNGIGFEAEYAERIFETFTRLNSKDTYEGTGLGLSLCRKIAERHGGRISAEGNPGKGSIFTIELPVKQKRVGI